jgi:hypothetical protein
MRWQGVEKLSRRRRPLGVTRVLGGLPGPGRMKA